MINKTIDLKDKIPSKPTLINNFGGKNNSESYAVCDHYLIRNGKAFFPIMGEFHYSRYPSQYWEESILKMKACGIEVIATYVFWIHIEEIKGEYDWQGNNDLRKFVELCKKHDMKILLRIGPWAHGECRNGGFPDWLIETGYKLRTNDERYLKLVKTFYGQIFNQVKGLLFDDDGPIIGIQLENEYGHCGGLQGEEGKEHIRALKKIAIETGFKVPFYTSTGWGNGVVVEGETLPVLGGYPEAPWDQHIKERRAAAEYLFSPIKCETSIGTDLSSDNSNEFSYDVKKYPYFTAELGGGLQITHHRRPTVSGDDIGALALAFLGSGTNLLGYYMFHGGTNPHGKLTTLQESKATGYLNDLPELSYDFQAPVNEYGLLNPSYGRLKAIHMFIHDFGENMARSSCYLPEDVVTDAENMDDLRYSVRYGDTGGFLFLSNYERRRNMTDKSNVNITVSTENGDFKFENINLPNKKYTFVPFDFDLGGAKLITATSQLLCSIVNDNKKTFVFFTQDTDNIRYRFDAKNIKKVVSLNNSCDNGILEIVSDNKEYKKPIEITLESGEAIKIVTISSEDAYNSWKIKRGDNEYLLICNAGIIDDGKALKFTSKEEKINLCSYPKLPEGLKVTAAKLSDCENNTAFANCLFEFNKPEVPACAIIVAKHFEDNGVLTCELAVTRTKGGNISDDFLAIPFEGDRARLFIDGNFSADWFYSGVLWNVGLKRFGCIDNSKIKVEIQPIKKDDYVFLENKPNYINGTACSLNNVSIRPEYCAKIEFEEN